MARTELGHPPVPQIVTPRRPRILPGRPPRRPIVLIPTLALIAGLAGGYALRLATEPGPRTITTAPERPSAPAPGPGVILHGAEYDLTVFPGIELLAAAPDGGLWARPPDAIGLVQVDANGRWHKYSTEQGLPPGVVADLAVAEDGTVWATTGEELGRFDGDTWTTVHGGLDMFWNLAVTSDGTLWATGLVTTGTGYAGAEDQRTGVARLREGVWTVFDDPDGLPEARPVSLAVAPAGAVWVGFMGDYGFWPPGIEPRPLAMFDGETWTTYPRDSGPGLVVSSLAVGPDGSVWALVGRVDTDEDWVWGLTRFDGQNWEDYRGELARAVSGGLFGGDLLAVGPEGRLWVAECGGAQGGGLASFADEAWAQDRIGCVRAVAVASDGTVWAERWATQTGAESSLWRLTPGREGE